MNRLKVTESQDKLVDELVNTIIPKTELPGAKDLNVKGFVWVMADDCLSDDLQNIFLNGLTQFEERFKQVSGSAFSSSDQQERISNLNSIIAKENSDEKSDHIVFLEVIKTFTIQGYMQSEYIMKDVMPYNLIPGKNPTCEPVEPNQNVNINA